MTGFISAKEMYRPGGVLGYLPPARRDPSPLNANTLRCKCSSSHHAESFPLSTSDRISSSKSPPSAVACLAQMAFDGKTQTPLPHPFLSSQIVVLLSPWSATA